MAHFSAKKCITLGPNYQARTAQEVEDARERMENCIASFPSKTICCYKMRKACGSCVEPSPLKIFGLMFDAEAIHAQNPSNIQPNYHVTMDNLMKLVLAALEWSYEAKAPDVQVEWLERAAELLVLRHDTFRIIDGEGPGVETEQASEAERDAASEIPAQQVSPPLGEQKPPSLPTEQVTQAP